MFYLNIYKDEFNNVRILLEPTHTPMKTFTLAELNDILSRFLKDGDGYKEAFLKLLEDKKPNEYVNVYDWIY